MKNEPLDYSPTSSESTFYFHKPGLAARIKSMLADSIVVIVLMLIASWILNALSVESGTVRGWSLFGIFLYEPLATTFGATFGQAIMGLKVSRIADVSNAPNQQRAISLPAAILRYLVKLLLGWISLLTITSDRYGQALHDKAAGSVVCFRNS